MRDPSRFGGQTVIIVGRSVGTSEGSWLDEDCGLDRLLKTALAEVKKTTRLQPGASWHAVYGRLDHGQASFVLSDGRTAMTSGYGHFSAAPAQAVAKTDSWLNLP